MKKRDILWFVLSQINRKPIKNSEDRKNFELVIYDYIIDLESLTDINVKPMSAAFEQKQYLDRLLTLTERYNSIGNEAVPEQSLDGFLAKLQKMCRIYLDNDLDKDFYKERKSHHTTLAYTKSADELAPRTRLNNLKERAFQNLG